ncbi:hypothetical protein [Humisphaera borealis]|uniref:Uncharacterized protein n=1 Tax=Humisphaera borealis TaxID=2807512 RepID=A0A7M2WXD9_9BACT|nr:hypothetical protein [Humisphaera borealis]QOV90146.1 hypothetical protein IPV69_01870 [Humisphaera borealis]
MNQANSEDPAIAAAYKYIREEMAQGVSDEQIVLTMEDNGWNATTVRALCKNVRESTPAPTHSLNYASMYRNPSARPTVSTGGGDGGADMLVGGLICAVGLVITIGSYAAASSSSGGGGYVVAWGAILFGGIRFFRGLAARG